MSLDLETELKVRRWIRRYVENRVLPSNAAYAIIRMVTPQNIDAIVALLDERLKSDFVSTAQGCYEEGTVWYYIGGGNVPLSERTRHEPSLPKDVQETLKNWYRKFLG